MGGAIQPDESELLALAKKGDAAAFGQLVQIHQDWVFNLLWRRTGDESLAADLTQNVFLNLWGAIGRYDGRAKFSTWLYRIAINETISAHRRSAAGKRGGGVPTISMDAENAPELADNRAQGFGDPADAAEAGELSEQIFEAIRGLDAQSRDVVLLREVEGLSYEEIAEVLGMNTGTVRSKLSRARERLRETLRRLMGEE